VVEVPEHLLQRSREARARLTGEPADPAAEASQSDSPAVPASAAPAVPAAAPVGGPVPIPAAAVAPAPPKPQAPYVSAALSRRTVPVWVLPVLLFLPFWAFYYVGYLENPPASSEGLLAEGELAYAQCASCHGGGGGGTGSGRQLSNGEVLLTFPSLEAGAGYDGVAGHIAWVANGTSGTEDGAYGEPSRGRVPGDFGIMAGFGSSLSAEELIGVVYYERVVHGGLDAEAAEAELHLLEEVVHLIDAQGVALEGMQAAEVQQIVDEARALLGGDEVASG